MSFSIKRISLIIALLFCSSFLKGEEIHSYLPEEGYVPNEETAIKIAVAVWIPIYGKKSIEGKAPYHAKLNNDIWTVHGSLPKKAKRVVGGVPVIDISKNTGEILRVSHGK